MSREDRDQDEIVTSVMSQVFDNTTPLKAAVDLYVVDGKPAAEYVRARLHRVEAANAMLHAADREVDSGAGRLAFEFSLTDAADDWGAIGQITCTIHGDHATGKPPEGVASEPFWMPEMRRIGDDWKIDLKDETDGDIVTATHRAEDEAKAIEHITADIDGLKFETVDQLRAALKRSNIKGTGKPM